MPKIKIVLVEIRDSKNWTGGLCILPKGIYQFQNSNGVEHTITSSEGNSLKCLGKIYQMVGFNPTSIEEDRFLPIDESQWRLCSRFIPRENGNYVIGLTSKGKLYNHKWENAQLLNGAYVLFKPVNVKKE